MNSLIYREFGKDELHYDISEKLKLQDKKTQKFISLRHNSTEQNTNRSAEQTVREANI